MPRSGDGNWMILAVVMCVTFSKSDNFGKVLDPDGRQHARLEVLSHAPESDLSHGAGLHPVAYLSVSTNFGAH
jgi:hypothetical protein